MTRLSARTATCLPAPLASRLALGAMTAVVVALIVGTWAAPPAEAAARVSATNERGTTMADTSYRTKLTIRGTGFQSIQGGFGGVYVAFGWVRDPGGGGWKPSRGGITGRDYRYVPDSESSNNQGFLRFVAFPGSSTAGEAQAVMSASGQFTVDLTVPGPVFNSTDRSGNVVTVDCRKVVCGVITIGAHGVKNARNETFTRVPFGTVFDDQPTSSESAAATPSATPSAGDATESAGPAAPSTTAAAAPSGKPRVHTDRGTAQAGRPLPFTGRGFLPGEQVLAILDDGVVALGPMQAGESGEIAGVLALPADLEPGTHELRLQGAASGVKATQRFPVRAAAAQVAAPASSDTADDPAAVRVFVAVAGSLFVLSVVLLLLRLWRRGSRSGTAVPRDGPRRAGAA